MTATAPFEIIAAPFDVYLAVAGTAQPDISVAPPVAWKLLGTSGNKNYDEDGVHVQHGQTIETFTPVGLTAPRKAFRTEEKLTISFHLVDVSPVHYAAVLNQATITTVVAGVMIGGASKVPLLQGYDVTAVALLARSSVSPFGPAFNSQYYVPLVYQSAEPDVQYQKGKPAFLACEFAALWDSTNGFGQYVTQSAAAM